MQTTEQPLLRRGLTMAPLAVSAIWFALYAQWFTIPPIILPSQIAGLVANPGNAEMATGIIAALGGIVALVAAPLVGALSDGTRGLQGRRRPFLISGTFASCIALVLFGWAGQDGGLIIYALAYLHLQFWWNWVAGPYAGLIPDVVPVKRQAAASGWMNVLIILGIIAGNAVTRFFYTPRHPAPVIGAFIVLNLLCLMVTVMGVREPPASGAPLRRSTKAFFRSFYLSPRQYPSFYLVLGTRFLSNMGIWSVFTFLVFYLETVFNMSQDASTRLLAMLFIVGACLAIPASLAGVWLADRYGLVRVVQIVSWIMAVSTAAYVLIAIHPALALIIPVIVVFSAANGAYGAVDWYLALRVLPRGQDTGKDFGIWHVCLILPQIIGPASTGVLITAAKTLVSPEFAYELAFGIGAIWFILAAALVGRVRLAPAG